MIAAGGERWGALVRAPWLYRGWSGASQSVLLQANEEHAWLHLVPFHMYIHGVQHGLLDYILWYHAQIIIYILQLAKRPDMVQCVGGNTQLAVCASLCSTLHAHVYYWISILKVMYVILNYSATENASGWMNLIYNDMLIDKGFSYIVNTLYIYRYTLLPLLQLGTLMYLLSCDL